MSAYSTQMLWEKVTNCRVWVTRMAWYMIEICRIVDIAWSVRCQWRIRWSAKSCGVHCRSSVLRRSSGKNHRRGVYFLYRPRDMMYIRIIGLLKVIFLKAFWESFRKGIVYRIWEGLHLPNYRFYSKGTLALELPTYAAATNRHLLRPG